MTLPRSGLFVFIPNLSAIVKGQRLKALLADGPYLHHRRVGSQWRLLRRTTSLLTHSPLDPGSNPAGLPFASPNPRLALTTLPSPLPPFTHGNERGNDLIVAA